MTHGTPKWGIDELSSALANAIFQRAHNRLIQQSGHNIKFNGFWRDGDKQNVCAWLDKATWHDAKTGDGGGIKEFARVAFNMTLTEFMRDYGRGHILPQKPISTNAVIRKDKGETRAFTIDVTWQSLVKRDEIRLDDNAAHWLAKTRGFPSPRRMIGSGFANLAREDVGLFDQRHSGLINQRLSLGPQLVVPIRGVHSNKVQNLFLRAISEVPKQEKSRLLTDAGGWSDDDGSPRAFGFPGLIHEFPNLILCEGMADYFALECLLHGERKYLPLGASNAAALPKWAEWLVTSRYKGRVIWVYQLDANSQGEITASAIGQLNATKASKILKVADISSELFKWSHFLKKIPVLKKIPEDFAEIYSLSRDNPHLLTEIFLDLY